MVFDKNKVPWSASSVALSDGGDAQSDGLSCQRQPPMTPAPCSGGFKHQYTHKLASGPLTSLKPGDRKRYKTQRTTHT